MTFNFFKKKKECDVNMYKNCSLILDSMSIRKDITFSQKLNAFIGFEDLGNKYRRKNIFQIIP